MHRAMWVIVLLCTVFQTSSVWAENPPTLLLEWGSYGLAQGQFEGSMGIAVDGHGNVFVAEQRASHRIQKFDGSGRFLKSWGSLGSQALF